jgi:hypothetical protein
MLVIGAATDWLTGRDFPVSPGVIAAFGIGFLLAGASQFGYFIRGPRRVLLELAAGNAAMGFAGLTWLILSGHFSTAGAAILGATSAWKIGIGALQIRALIGSAALAAGS